jgi:hypothetical protein
MPDWIDTPTPLREKSDGKPLTPEECDRILEHMISRYRSPILQTIRLRWPQLTPPDVEDRCHDFIQHRLLGPKSIFLTYDPRREGRSGGARLRDYLGAALNNYLIDADRRQNARGGRFRHISLNANSAGAGESFTAPSCVAQPLPGTQGPRGITITFETEWAGNIMANAALRLQAMYDDGREGAALLPVLMASLRAKAGLGSQEEAAGKLGVSLRTYHRMRRSLREAWRGAVRAEVAATVSHPGDIDDELRYLREILRG